MINILNFHAWKHLKERRTVSFADLWTNDVKNDTAPLMIALVQ